MKKYCALLVMVFLLPLLHISAQESVKVIKSEFEQQKDGFRDAWKNIKEGDRLFESGVGLYPDAVVSYLLASEYNSANAELNYKIGVSYLFGAEPLKSLDYLLRAYEIKPDVAEDILLLIGQSYQYRGDYGKAIDSYNMYSDKYHASRSFNTEVNNFIKQCNMAIEMRGEANVAEIINPGISVNSEYDDYSPVLSNQGMLLYFTTRRPLDIKRQRQDYDMKWDENIYVATKEGEGWNNAGSAGDKLTTVLNEGVLFIAASGRLMYLYAGYEGNGDILVSEFERGRWGQPVQPEIKFNSSNARETSISFTDDGNEIFFTSDRRKGLGGRDIYYMKRVRRNKWTRPFNLGKPVNTERNEESVHVSANGDTIWFSSNRQGGMGGYDVYMSLKDKIGLWSEPVNLGMPVNSQSNDLFYKANPFDNNEAWLASDRPGGYGGLDIYRILMNNDAVTTDVTDADTLYIIPDTLNIVQDTIVITPDTLTIMRDTRDLVPDTVTLIRDTLDLVPDTVTLIRDTLNIVPDTLKIFRIPYMR
ncbi:MAG: PD40 domain-containing protein [Bacteroidales bacterium]|nr:PD40 domain-containing protein [Bacteroidales bacterium]